MRLRLKLESDGTSFALDRSPFLVGRISDADFPVELKGVSRRHALFVEYLTGWVVHDLRSVQGIRINKKKTRRGEIQPGDRLDLGALTVVVEEDRDPANSNAGDHDTRPSCSTQTFDSEDFFVDVIHGPDREPTLCHAGRLEIYDDHRCVEVVRLERDAILGYADRADIVLPRRGISSLHCLFAHDSGSWYVHDLKSTNGVLHRGMPSATLPLADADELEIGDFRVVFRSEPRGNEAKRSPRVADSQSQVRTTASIAAAAMAPGPAEESPSNLDRIPAQTKEWIADAEKALREHRPKRAIHLLTKACAAAPYVLTWRDQLRKAQRQSAGGRPTRYPYHLAPALFYYQARSAWAVRSGNPAKALQLAEKGLRFDPWNRSLLLLEAHAFEQSRKLDLSVWSLLMARERDPHDPHVNRPLARILQYVGAYDKALAVWKQVAKHDPDNPEVQRQIRMALVQKTLKAGGYDDPHDEALAGESSMSGTW